jgi:hypothetical protein
MGLTDAGRMVELVWGELPVRFDHIELDEFVVMPNHIHGIFVLYRRGEPCVRPMFDQPAKQGEHKVRPYGTLPNTVGRIVQTFKSLATHEYINGVKQHGGPPFPGKLRRRNADLLFTTPSPLSAQHKSAKETQYLRRVRLDT